MGEISETPSRSSRVSRLGLGRQPDAPKETTVMVTARPIAALLEALREGGRGHQVPAIGLSPRLVRRIEAVPPKSRRDGAALRHEPRYRVHLLAVGYRCRLD